MLLKFRELAIQHSTDNYTTYLIHYWSWNYQGKLAPDLSLQVIRHMHHTKQDARCMVSPHTLTQFQYCDEEYRHSLTIIQNWAAVFSVFCRDNLHILWGKLKMWQLGWWKLFLVFIIFVYYTMTGINTVNIFTVYLIIILLLIII